MSARGTLRLRRRALFRLQKFVSPFPSKSSPNRSLELQPQPPLNSPSKPRQNPVKTRLKTLSTKKGSEKSFKGLSPSFPFNPSSTNHSPELRVLLGRRVEWLVLTARWVDFSFYYHCVVRAGGERSILFLLF